MPSVNAVQTLGDGRTRVGIEVPDSKYLPTLEAAYRRNLDFWLDEPTDLRIVVTEDDDRFRELAGPYYDSVIAGVTTDAGLVVFRGMESLSRDPGGINTWEHLENGLSHEIGHGFWVKLLRGGLEQSWAPLWVAEGIPAWIGKERWNIAREDLLGRLAKVYGEWTPDSRALTWDDMSYIGSGTEKIALSFSLWAEYLKHLTSEAPSVAIHMLKELGPNRWTQAEFDGAFRATFGKGAGDGLVEFTDHLSFDIIDR